MMAIAGDRGSAPIPMFNVLIVEDNAAYRQSLRQLLECRFPDLRICEAVDAADALRQVLSGRFDLIFMDIRLPNGNGLDLTRAIKARVADTMICVISSHAIDEYRLAAMRNGADHFLVKGDSSDLEIVGLIESWRHDGLAH